MKIRTIEASLFALMRRWHSTCQTNVFKGTTRLRAALGLAVFAASLLPADAATVGGAMRFSDGALASAYDHCGDADLCATVQYQNGSVLSIYSEGAAFCQPYLVHFVLVHGPTTIYEFSRTLNHDPINSGAIGSRCGHSRSTQMTLDHGLVHLTVDELPDGSLHFSFSPTAFATPQGNE